MFMGGVLIKSVLIVAPNFNKKDLVGIGASLATGVLVFLRASLEVSISKSIFAGLIFFIIVLSFAFKDRILPRITEGTLLLYGLVALYLFEVHFVFDGFFHEAIRAALLIYCLLVLALCVARVRVKPIIQVVLFVCFILLNLLIIVSFIQLGDWHLFCIECPNVSLNNWGYFFTGYVFFNLTSNILYILYFLPIPLSKNQTRSQRISEIKKHARDLEEKYIDIDIGFHRTVLIVIIGGCLFLNHVYGAVDDVLLVSLVLVLGGILTTSSD